MGEELHLGSAVMRELGRASRCCGQAAWQEDVPSLPPAPLLEWGPPWSGVYSDSILRRNPWKCALLCYVYCFKFLLWKECFQIQCQGGLWKHCICTELLDIKCFCGGWVVQFPSPNAPACGWGGRAGQVSSKRSSYDVALGHACKDPAITLPHWRPFRRWWLTLQAVAGYIIQC